ncbi:hypothetical protein GJR88_02271 [Dietzia sp. DQ12-45-1b]|nr:hypothetical protein GJR88_02271 [Dietzia sp. DQ12-45-1b]
MLLIQIEELRDFIVRLDHQRNELMGERDQFILHALEAKVPVTEIVSASGVNRVRICQIRAEQKEGTSWPPARPSRDWSLLPPPHYW